MTDARPWPVDMWVGRDPRRAAEVGRATVRELERLFGVQLQAEASASRDLPALARHVGEQLDALVGAEAALVAFLAPEQQRAGVSLFEAMAEILFVPRTERSEYRYNRLASPPWDIRRLLLEYAVWSQRVDAVATRLTAGFCARACERLPVGCCEVLGYDMGIVPEAMLRAQVLEAQLSGWRPPQREDQREDKCKFHGSSGCCLRRFKSPACAGMLCDALVADLRQRFALERRSPFLSRLAVFRNQRLNRAEVFEAMAAVVAAAERLSG